MNQKSAWYMEMRIRAQMVDDDTLLKGIVEADETYIGGKPRCRERTRGRPKSKAGRGTNKASVIGAVARGGRVVAELAYDISGRTIRKFLLSNIDKDETILITDEYCSCNVMDDLVERHVIKHTEKKYVDGEVHTNTIEGFWSEVKRAFHGTHHWYSKKWLPLYIQESCFKRNHRHDENLFMDFLEMCVEPL